VTVYPRLGFRYVVLVIFINVFLFREPIVSAVVVIVAARSDAEPDHC
jgi:hypothetical protein